jgi:lipoate-protein ligase A
MITRLTVVETRSQDPHRNLALEEHLLDLVEPGQCILYLWQNRNTVVIGRNQNTWKECRTALLEQEGGHLARRLSGGGAVFHDLGNLNFTFLLNQSDYDIHKQMEVIRLAVQSLGIPAEVSGRNDILSEGRKFSGNAFYHHGGKAYHHGTILVDTDPEKMARYLTPPKAKLKAKGIPSVRSRVVNLKELAPDLSIDGMKEYLIQAFGEVYGKKPTLLPAIDPGILQPIAAEFADPAYLFGRSPQCDILLEERFDWGQMELQLTVQKGCIQEIAAYTDAMDHTLAPAIRSALQGAIFTAEEIRTALAPLPYPADLWSLLSKVL